MCFHLMLMGAVECGWWLDQRKTKDRDRDRVTHQQDGD